MRKLALCLIALLIVATLAEDVEAGRRHRRRARRCYYYQPCVPCCAMPCPSPAIMRTGFPQTCPYYSMGSIWYAEYFEASCPGPPAPVQVAFSYSGSEPMHCPNCEPVAGSPTRSNSDEFYLCQQHDADTDPDWHNPNHVVDSVPAQLAKITHINGKPVPHNDAIYVAYYRMKTKIGGRPFTVGYECFQTGNHPIKVTSEPGAPGVFKEVSPGPGVLPMLIRLTERAKQYE
jgi:hypothetical protein